MISRAMVSIWPRRASPSSVAVSVCIPNHTCTRATWAPCSPHRLRGSPVHAAPSCVRTSAGPRQRRSGAHHACRSHLYMGEMRAKVCGGEGEGEAKGAAQARLKHCGLGGPVLRLRPVMATCPQLGPLRGHGGDGPDLAQLDQRPLRPCRGLSISLLPSPILGLSRRRLNQ